jgi:membrane fusion protein (multidrug efflux system)
MSKPIKRTLIIAIILIVAGLIIWPRLNSSKAGNDKGQLAGNEKGPKSGAGGPGGPGGPITVNVVVVQAQPLSNVIQSNGTLLANEEVDIRSEISGIIQKINFKEGQKVQKGQLLASLNDDELQAQAARLEYTIKLNKEVEYRQQQLLEREAISRQEYDIALADLNTVKADLQRVKAQIARYYIRAPFTGEIGLRYVSEGSYVSPTTQIASMQDIDRVKIEFTVPEKYSDLVQRGDSITFSVRGNERKYKAHVYAIESKIDLATRSLRVRAIAPNPDRTLIPGSYARIELTLERIPDAVLIPSEALIPELQGQKVYLLKGGRAIPSRVKTGIRTSREVQVTEGVSPRDSLIVTGLLQVKDSAQVKVKDVKTSETYKPLDRKQSE